MNVISAFLIALFVLGALTAVTGLCCSLGWLVRDLKAETEGDGERADLAPGRLRTAPPPGLDSTDGGSVAF